MCIIVPILQTSLRLRDVECLTQGHTAPTRQRQGSSRGLSYGFRCLFLIQGPPVPRHPGMSSYSLLKSQLLRQCSSEAIMAPGSRPRRGIWAAFLSALQFVGLGVGWVEQIKLPPSPGSHPSEEEGTSGIPGVALGRAGKNQSILKTVPALQFSTSRSCQVA